MEVLNKHCSRCNAFEFIGKKILDKLNKCSLEIRNCLACDLDYTQIYIINKILKPPRGYIYRKLVIQAFDFSFVAIINLFLATMPILMNEN